MIPTWIAVANGVIVGVTALGFYSIGLWHGRRSR